MELSYRLLNLRKSAPSQPAVPAPRAAGPAPAPAGLASDRCVDTWVRSTPARPAAAQPTGGGLTIDGIRQELDSVRKALQDLIDQATSKAAPAPAPAPAPATPEGGKGPVLKTGTSGDPVKRLQQRLAELGFDAGGADGVFGPKTDAAVKAFQQSRGIAVDGIVGTDTWNKLGVTVEGTVTQEGGKGPVMRQGVSGDPVKRMQQRLAELGFDAGGADGAFGPKTDAAVKAFQQSRGLEADGIVGPATWNKLGITVEGSVSGPGASAGPDGATVQTQDGAMVSRQGKLISPQIAGAFDRMVADAARAGVSLRINDGYRSSAEQAELYALYKAGKGAIAAPPGQSMHNRGLAIDFTNTPGAYAWLKAHASAYGLHNFDPEPWHYSTTGG